MAAYIIYIEGYIFIFVSLLLKVLTWAYEGHRREKTRGKHDFAEILESEIYSELMFTYILGDLNSG